MQPIPRRTERKAIIRELMRERESPILLAELRSRCHRIETRPTCYNERLIPGSYIASFNRTVRSLGPELRSFPIGVPLNRGLAGIVARLFMAQALHKGVYQDFPDDPGIELFLFNEVSIVEGPISYGYSWWLTGAITRSSGKLARFCSIPITANTAVVWHERPSPRDLARSAKVPWPLFELVEEMKVNVRESRRTKWKTWRSAGRKWERIAPSQPISHVSMIREGSVENVLEIRGETLTRRATRPTRDIFPRLSYVKPSRARKRNP